MRLGRCFTFWYSISGKDAGYLTFYIKDISSKTSIAIWKSGGFDMANNWTFGSFGFYYDKPYSVSIEGTSGGASSSIALDDVFFRESHYCAVTPDSANFGPGFPLPGKPAPTTKSPAILPSIHDCDFEKNFCAWKNDYTRPLNWTRYRGSTDSYETGPSVDHTLGTTLGWYIYLEASYPAKQNDTCRLVSALVSSTSTVNCLTFYYHMRGRHVGRLNILVRPENTNESLAWSKEGNQGNFWIKGQVNMDYDSIYTIIFEGVRGNDYEVIFIFHSTQNFFFIKKKFNY